MTVGISFSTPYIVIHNLSACYYIHDFKARINASGYSCTDNAVRFKIADKLYCSGGCAANSYHATGSITGVYEYGCELFRKRMECAIMIQVAQNQELAAQGIEVPIQLGSTCNACADGEVCE